jgi:hypothetical protein
MGLTVAPLTTTVMSALDTQLAGTASGVNNAVTRIAGAIAVMGTVVLIAFKSAVADETSRLPLSPAAREEVMGQALDFGDASVPGSVSKELAGEVELSLKGAFVDSFRIIMFLYDQIAWMSALAAAVFVGWPSPQLPCRDRASHNRSPIDKASPDRSLSDHTFHNRSMRNQASHG